MNANDQLDELLLKWDEHREAGHELSAEELCGGDGQLAAELDRYIAAMKGTDWLFEDDGNDIDQTFEQSTAETEVILPSLTVAEFTQSLSDSGLFTDDEVQQLRGSDAKADAASLADRLIAEGKLTRYQARVLLQKKSDPLFIDKYLILDAVGSGGMGVVFKALQKSMDRVVALKVLPKSAVDSPDKVQRFQREARAAAKLSHPNIATAHDADEWNGMHFLVMEYVAGCNLVDEVEQQGTLSVSQAVDYMSQAARGLVHAHERGIIHRDIKPANLIIANDGVVKVVDMGLASIERSPEDAAQYSTMVGTVMGTAAYMSPEQAADTTEADHRSDIYSLGATLYFLLAGTPPYHEPTAMKTMLAHRDASVPSLCAARSDVPQELDQVYQRMLAKDPNRRFQSAAELVAALEALPAATTAPLPSDATTANNPAALRPIRDVGSKPQKEVLEQPTNIPARLITILLSITVLFAIGAAAIFRVATDNGELIINAVDPGVEVAVKRDEQILRDLTVEQGEAKTTVRSGRYVIELKGINADRFVLDHEVVTISRGERVVVTVTRRDASGVSQRTGLPAVTLPLNCRFNDHDEAKNHWVWNDEFTFSEYGAKALKGAESYLRSRHRFTGDVTFDLEFSFGQAQFTNTGGASIVVWNKRIPIARSRGRLDTWIHIHREANEIVFVQNDEERRIALERHDVTEATAISIFWRSRGSHFRSIKIAGGAVAPPTSGLEHSFHFTNRAHTDEHWSWNDDFVFAGDGGMTPRGAGSFLRSRGRFSSKAAIDLDFSLGEASYNNTGGASITVWDKKLSIARDSKPVDLKIHIHVENNAIVFRQDGKEERIPVDASVLAEPTAIDIRWRSRTAHFRSIEISTPTKRSAP